jgi:hypothetical protein
MERVHANREVTHKAVSRLREVSILRRLWLELICWFERSDGSRESRLALEASSATSRPIQVVTEVVKHPFKHPLKLFGAVLSHVDGYKK